MKCITDPNSKYYCSILYQKWRINTFCLSIEFLGKKKVRPSRKYVTDIHDYVINCKISINISMTHKSSHNIQYTDGIKHTYIYIYTSKYMNSARLKDMKSRAKTQKYNETAVAKC